MSQQRRTPTPGGKGAEPSPVAVVEPTATHPTPLTETTAGSTPTAAVSDKPVDVLYVHKPCESGEGYRVLRQRGERLEVGEIRSMREGQPIHGQVVRLTPRQESDRLFDVDVLVDSPKSLSRGGPPQVASDRYRRNWETIFGDRGSKRAKDEASN
jgi:hypothetical protein